MAVIRLRILGRGLVERLRRGAADLDRVNALILARTGSEVAMIPEVANPISSGGKRLRPC